MNETIILGYLKCNHIPGAAPAAAHEDTWRQAMGMWCVFQTVYNEIFPQET